MHILYDICQWCSLVGQALASRHLEAKFYGLGLTHETLGLGIGLEGPGLGLGLESCIDNVLASPSNPCKIINSYWL